MIKKYELTEEIVDYRGSKLYRISALKDFSDVKKGDLGGFVEKESNLSHIGNCWIYDYGWVYQEAKVLNNAKVLDKAAIYGSAKLADNACISEYVTVFEQARIQDFSTVSGQASVFGNALVSADAKVSGLVNLTGNIQVSREVIIKSKIESPNKIDLNADVLLFGDITISSPNELVTLNLVDLFDVAFVDTENYGLLVYFEDICLDIKRFVNSMDRRYGNTEKGKLISELITETSQHLGYFNFTKPKG